MKEKKTQQLTYNCGYINIYILLKASRNAHFISLNKSPQISNAKKRVFRFKDFFAMQNGKFSD